MALYDDILAAESAPPLGADPRFAASLELNTESKPDEIARNRAVAKQLGVPAAAVDALPQESMKAARIKQIDTDTASAPILREKFINEDFAKLAHDESGSLSKFEGALSALGSAAKWATSAPGTEGNNLFSFTKRGTTNLVGGATVGLGAGLMDVAAVGYDAASAATSWALPVDVFGQQAANAREGANRARESLDWLQGGKATSSTQAGIDSGLRSTGTNLALFPLAIQSALARGAEAGGSMIAGIMGSQVAAEAYNNAREKGMERIGAATYAIPQGVFEFAFEKIPASRLLNDMAKNSGLLRMAANQVLPEVLGEQATTILQDLNEQVRLNPDKTMRQFIEERPDAAYQTLIATLVGIGTQSSVVKAFAPSQAEAFKAQVDAQKTEAEVAQIKELFTAATESKLRERSPETFQDLVQSIADSDTNAAPSTVFIDAQALTETLQQSGITEQQLAELMPSVPSQLQEALTTNGTVEIPIGELMARVAGTGLENTLLQHIRTTPDALSQAEAKEAGKEAERMLVQDAERVVNDSMQGAERALSAAVVQGTVLGQLERSGRFTSDVNTAYASLVRDFYTATSARLNMTPEELYARYPLQVGATAPAGVSLEQAETASRAQTVQTEADKIVNGQATIDQINDPTLAADVAEAVARTGRYQQALLGGRDISQVNDGELNQLAALTPTVPVTETTAFKAWFGDSKVVDADGKPLVVYHGTTADVETFAPERAGEFGQRFANAVFFSSSPIVAGGYAQRLDADPVHTELTAREDEQRSTYGKAVLQQFQETKTTTGPIADAAREPYDATTAERRDRRRAIFSNEVVTPGANVSPVFLSLKNPVEVNGEGKNFFDVYDAAFSKAAASGADGIIFRNVYDAANEVAREPSDVFVAFEPTQIKSATGNKGTFDANDPSILNQEARGTFNPSSLQITLLERADLSTFLHETGHAFLEIMSDIASQPNAPAEVQQDMDTVLKWFGVKDIATWRGMSLDQQRANHEKFAESFEQFLFEGRAPSRELQPLFAKFRAWMVNVYRSLSQFLSERNTQLSDDVRSVFDRLLADADQIADAQRSQAYAPAFESIADSGMTLEEWERYQGTGARATTEAMDQLQARSLRDMQWTVNARGKVLSKLQREAKTKRKAIEAEITAEVDAEPAYAAMRWLKTGVLPDGTQTVGGKLSTTALREMYGENPAAPWRYLSTDMIAAQDGLHPDVVAEILDYESGDKLVRDIVAQQPRDVEIEGRTDQRMLERYGDLATPDALKRAANEAIHNEARSRFIATELKAMQDALNPREKVGTTATGRRITVNALQEAAKRFAERMIAGRKIMDVKPGQHEAAERRAGKRFEKAQSSGDTTAAITAKRDQLLNNYATKLSYDALREIESKVKYLKKVGDSETISTDYRDQIQKLLERYDLRTSTTRGEIDRRASLVEWVEAQRELGIEPNIPPELLNEAQAVSYKQMTVEEFRGLHDSIKQIEHIGRLKQKLLTNKDKRDFEQVRDAIVASIVDNGQGRTADTRTPNTILGEKLLGLKKFWASHIKAATWARVMDGGKDGGAVWEYIIRAGNDAGNKETTMVAKSTQELAKLLSPVLAQGKMGGKGTFFPSINRSVNREGAIAMALNTGNESNMQRLLGGEGWTPEAIRPVLDTLTTDEWAFVQGVWDYFESFRSEIAAKEKRVNGVEPKWLEPVGRMEKGVQLKGGYYPVKYDPRASERAEAHADAESAKAQMKGAYTSSTTRRSFTKERVDAVIGRPLLYSLDGIYSGVQEIIHDLSWHEFLIDANRLLKDKAISATMRGTYGPEAHQQFKTWLQDTAQGYAQANTNAEAAFAWIRQGVSVAGLGFNLMSAMIQPLGLTQSVTRVGARYTAKGVMEYVAGPIALKEKIAEKSEFMATRAMTRLREIAEVKGRVKGKSAVREAIDGSAYFLMMQAQQTVDLPTWWGAYEKAIGEGNAEERSVALADQAVIDSQGSGSIKDQAAIERGGPALKLFTVFYSFFNTTLNNAVASTMSSSKSKAQTMADYALLFVVPVILTELLKSAMTPGDSGDWEDPKKIAKKVVGAEISFMTGLMVGVREAGLGIQVATGTNPYGTDYQGPAGLRLFTDTTKLAKQANQGEADDGLRKAIINTSGTLLRLPAAQINRSINGAKALAEGKTKNPSALLLGYEEPQDKR